MLRIGLLGILLLLAGCGRNSAPYQVQGGKSQGAGTVTGWKAPPPPPPTAEETRRLTEIEQLRQENQRLRQENESLRKQVEQRK